MYESTKKLDPVVASPATVAACRHHLQILIFNIRPRPPLDLSIQFSMVFYWLVCRHRSNQKNLGWLGYIGDEILPDYIGIIINHYKDPY